MSNYFDDVLGRVGEEIKQAEPIDFSRPLGESVPYIPVESSPGLYGAPTPEFSPHITERRTNYIPNVFTGDQSGNSFAQEFGGAGSVRQGAVFPERIGIDLGPLWAALSTRGVQTTVGLLKFIPGNPVGEALGRLGETIQNLPVVGGALDFVREVVTGPAESLKFLASTPVVGGKDVWTEMLQGKNPWDTLVNNFEASKEHLGALADVSTVALAAFGGPGGLLLRQGAKTTVGRFIAGMSYPFRGPKGNSILEWFVAPMTAPLFKEAGKRELAKEAGRTFSRFAIGAQAAGLGIGSVIDATQEPDSWVVKEVANNRLIPEGSPWELPFELAMGLPLDIFGAAKAVGAFARSTSLSGKVATALGESNPIDKILPGWQQAVLNGTVTRAAVEWVYQRGLRDAAMHNLMDYSNLEIIQRNMALLKASPGSELIPMLQHPWELHIGKQSTWDAVVRKEMDRIMRLPSQKRNEMIEAAIMGRGIKGSADYRPGWELIDDVAESARLPQLDNYYKIAKHVDTALSGRMLLVDRAGIDRQARQAVEYLRGGAVEAGGRAPSVKTTPAVRDGYTRLFRGESTRAAAGSTGGARYTDDARTAAGIARGGTLYYVDVPTSDLGLYRSGTMGRGEIFDLTVAETRGRAVYEGFLPGETNREFWARTGKIGDSGEAAKKFEAKFTGTEEEIRTFEDKFPAFKDVYVRGATPEVTIGRIEALMGRIDDVPEPVKLGRLKNVFDDLERKIAKAGAKASPENIAARNAVRKEIEDIHNRVADGYKDAADLARKELDDRINYLASLEGEAAEAAWGTGRHMFDEVIDGLRRKISELRIREFEARYITGSRYLLGKQLDSPFQRVFDDADTAKMPAGRTSIGQLYDKLFGAIPQTRISREAYEKFTDELRAKGLTQAQVYDVLRDMGDELDKSTKVFPTGARVQKYASIFNLPKGTVDRIISARAGAAVAKGTNWHEVLYRAYPGPLKVFQDQVFGSALRIPYNKHTVEIARTYMPMFRFYFSPRFIAMNFFEPQFFDFFIRGGGKIRGADMERMMAQQAQLGRARMDWESGEKLEQNMRALRAVSKIPFGKGDDEMVDAVLDTLYRSETNKDFLKEMGIKNETQFVQKVREAVEQHRNIIAGSVDESMPEFAMRKEIDELKKGLDDRLLSMRARVDVEIEIAQKEKILRDRVIARHAKDEMRMQKIPQAMRPFIDLWENAYRKTAEDAREVLYGNPRRSAVERAANSFLLYWPISYQIKATRAMFEFMTSRGFGYKTNLAPAQATAHMIDWHREKLETDPEYRNFFKNNKQMLFLMQNFVPVTPGETGVSLGPVFRLPLQVARGYRTPGEAVEKYGDVGPLYDWNLLQQIVTEQSRKGRIFSDVLYREEN